MIAPLSLDEVKRVTDWSSETFADADGKTVVTGDWVELLRDIPAYGEEGELVAPAGAFATVVHVSTRQGIVSLDMALGAEQSVEAFERTSLLRRARAGDRQGGRVAPFPSAEGGRAGDGGGTAHTPRSRPATGSVSRARKMRKEPTVAERLLWAALRKLGANYRRQVPIGRFIVDFAHLDSKLLIEVDGYFHSGPEAAEKDAARTAWLVSEGFRVIRFDERAVRDDLSSVVDRIVAETVSPPSPALPPSRGKGGDSPERSLVGSSITVSVGEPWDFESSSGSNRLAGAVVGLLRQEGKGDGLILSVTPFPSRVGEVSTLQAFPRYVAASIGDLECGDEVQMNLSDPSTNTFLLVGAVRLS